MRNNKMLIILENSMLHHHENKNILINFSRKSEIFVIYASNSMTHS